MDVRMGQLVAELLSLAPLVKKETLRDAANQLRSSPLLPSRATRETRSRGAAAMTASSAGRKTKADSEPRSLKALRDVPLLFADELPRRLCSAKPPWGLFSKDVSQLGAPSNWSQLRSSNRSREHVNLCQRYAERLQRSGRLGSRPPLSRNQSCAVVGSGGTLRGSRSGFLIDSHDIVMRFNAAPAGGLWAEDVGRRTTVRLLTDKTIAVGSRRNDQHSSREGFLLY
ncbi:MAG: hypothetical protein SGPRY_004383, partial [Prymnesium sp.]